jgi:ankyrin repeat protein
MNNIKERLKNFKNINELDNYGFAPIHYATQQNNIELIKLLQSTYNCNLEVQDKDGNTPFHIAIIKKHNDIVKYFNDLNIIKVKIKNNEKKKQ